MYFGFWIWFCVTGDILKKMMTVLWYLNHSRIYKNLAHCKQCFKSLQNIIVFWLCTTCESDWFSQYNERNLKCEFFSFTTELFGSSYSFSISSNIYKPAIIGQSIASIGQMVAPRKWPLKTCGNILTVAVSDQWYASIVESQYLWPSLGWMSFDSKFSERDY